MTSPEWARRTTRRIPTILVAGSLVVVAAIAVSVGYPSLAFSSPPASSSSSAASRIPALRSESPGELGEAAGAVPGATVLHPAQPDPGALDAADGVIRNGTTILEGDVPGVANLDPDLREALRRAARDANEGGVEIFVTSGWRSHEYQEQLLRQAVSTYGSKKEAARWVATPKTSPHVSGNAVDIGLSDAMAWLSTHGAEYGLCQIYRNEPWHFELRPAAIDHGCPPMYADPTHDPRMRQ